MKAADFVEEADDLPCVVDAVCNGSPVGGGVVEGKERSAAEEEPVGARAVIVSSDDLPCVVDAVCNGAMSGQGIVDRDEGSVAIPEETVGAAGGIDKRADDLAFIVDP
jgi:hypothetical protein